MTALIPPTQDAIVVFDVSSNNETDQNRIDWVTFAAFAHSIHPQATVIIKVSQGDWYLNPFLHRQRWGAHAAGFLNVGLYTYLEVVASAGPNAGKVLSGAQNADFFFKMQGADGALVLGEFFAADVEDNTLPTADLGAFVYDALQRMAFGTALPGLRPLVYSGEWFANPHGLERDARLAQFYLWWASYTKTMPPVPQPWAGAGKGIACWQFDDQMMVPGVPFKIDVSWWLAGLPALRSIQWGFLPDPLTGQLIAGKPDIQLNDKGEAVDINAAIIQIGALVSKARLELQAGTLSIDGILATIQGDAAAIATVSGLLSK